MYPEIVSREREAALASLVSEIQYRSAVTWNPLMEWIAQALTYSVAPMQILLIRTFVQDMRALQILFRRYSFAWEEDEYLFEEDFLQEEIDEADTAEMLALPA